MPLFLLLGFLVVPVNQGCFLFGLSRSTPSHASASHALTPVVVLLLAGRLLLRGSYWSKLAGMAVAFSGVVVITPGARPSAISASSRGIFLILAAVFGWSLYTVLPKPLLERY